MPELQQHEQVGVGEFSAKELSFLHVRDVRAHWHNSKFADATNGGYVASF